MIIIFKEHVLQIAMLNIFDGDSLFNLSEKEQDAIASATDKVIEEYKGRAR